jgi:hypothetical protein
MPFQLHVTGLVLLSGIFLLSAPPKATPILTPIPPVVPVLISPANGAVMDNGCQNKKNGITWDFDWSDVPGATAYHLRVWRNPSLPIINNMAIPASQYHYDSPQSFVINSNLNGWRWMVRAKVHGVWGRWSAVRFFRVEKLNIDCQ